MPGLQHLTMQTNKNTPPPQMISCRRYLSSRQHPYLQIFLGCRTVRQDKLLHNSQVTLHNNSVNFCDFDFCDFCDQLL